VTAVPLLLREFIWTCPNCDTRARTLEPRPHTQFHNCPGTFGLVVPMVIEGTRCKIEAVEREDYCGADARGIQYAPADGRPYMSVITTRDDGNDCTVYAPTAIGAING
jgi:hypothetical protein